MLLAPDFFQIYVISLSLYKKEVKFLSLNVDF